MEMHFWTVSRFVFVDKRDFQEDLLLECLCQLLFKSPFAREETGVTRLKTKAHKWIPCTDSQTKFLSCHIPVCLLQPGGLGQFYKSTWIAKYATAPRVCAQCTVILYAEPFFVAQVFLVHLQCCGLYWLEREKVWLQCFEKINLPGHITHENLHCLSV